MIPLQDLQLGLLRYNSATLGGPTGVVPGESQLLTYDNADRLSRVCYTDTTCNAANTHKWTYDLSGNRTTEKLGTAPLKTLTYDAADQLNASTDGVTSKTWVYNANGDQTLSTGSTNTYNTAHQITSTTDNTTNLTYAYDAQNNRVNTKTTRPA